MSMIHPGRDTEMVVGVETEEWSSLEDERLRWDDE